MKRDLHSKRLLRSLDNFVLQMHILNQADNPKLVAQLVVKWTKAQPLLTKRLLEYILESGRKIDLGQEAIIVEKIIRNRLIKEFKQDNLTLTIRKILYTKDLVKLLTKTGGRVTDREQIYLRQLQNELGLSQQQGKTIKEQYLQSASKGSVQNILQTKNNPAPEDSYQELILLIEHSPIDDRQTQNDLVEKNSNQQKINLFKFVKRRGWWLLLTIPLLFLSVKTYNWQPDSQIVKATDVVQTKDKDKCVGSTGGQSPRMSLGEKLLTQKYSNLNPSSKIALYEATVAFSRCKYALAQKKFKQALKIAKNNPEALIYLNNVQVITQENLKIAVSVPLGNQSEIAWEILRGVAQAQTAINQQGGVKGKPLLVQIVNDDDNPKLVTQLAQQLAADRSIMAVIGHNDSNTSLTAANIYQKRGLVMISPTNSSAKLPGIGDYIMRTIPSVSVLANSLSSYALISSLNKIAICADSTSSSSGSFAQEFITDIDQNGGEIAAVKCDFAQENFNPVPIIEQAMAQNADALLLATSVTKIDQAVSLAQANQNRLALLGSHSLYTFETIETGQTAVAEMVLPTPWLPDTDPNSNFAENARKLWGATVNWRSAMSYDATQAIIQGLKQADSRRELQSILIDDNFSVNGATGVFQFHQGDRLGKVQLAYIDKPAQDSVNYQFLPLKIDQKIERFQIQL